MQKKKDLKKNIFGTQKVVFIQFWSYLRLTRELWHEFGWLCEADRRFLCVSCDVSVDFGVLFEFSSSRSNS